MYFRQGHPKGVACEPLTATGKETQQKPHKYLRPPSVAPIIDLSASCHRVNARVATSSVAMDNNPADALIGEVSLSNHHTLMTTDKDLAAVVEKMGGKVMQISC